MQAALNELTETQKVASTATPPTPPPPPPPPPAPPLRPNPPSPAPSPQANAEPTTTIVIAHRLSTIANADAIYVIKEGKLDEQGTHDQLLSKGGLYSQLWKQQGLGKTEESAKKDPKAVSKAAADDPASPMINSTDGGNPPHPKPHPKPFPSRPAPPSSPPRPPP